VLAGSQHTRIPSAKETRPIGPNHPMFIIAEIGVNHNGDKDLAKRPLRGKRVCPRNTRNITETVLLCNALKIPCLSESSVGKMFLF
jgi:hypothetical protein